MYAILDYFHITIFTIACTNKKSPKIFMRRLIEMHVCQWSGQSVDPILKVMKLHAF